MTDEIEFDEEKYGRRGFLISGSHLRRDFCQRCGEPMRVRYIKRECLCKHCDPPHKTHHCTSAEGNDYDDEFRRIWHNIAYEDRSGLS